MKFILIFLLVWTSSLSCNLILHESKNLIGEIDKKCKKSYPCEFKMSDIIKEDWDKMYIFKTTASLGFINNKLGFQYPFFEDVAERIVFTKGNSVVYHEDKFPSVEEIYDREITFILPDNLDYKEFMRETANFTIDRIKVKNKLLFQITPEN